MLPIGPRIACSTFAFSRSPATFHRTRKFATVHAVGPTARDFKVVIVGGGAAGLSAGHQLLRSGKFARDEIAIIDPARWHDYQPGWTLVGGGLKSKEKLRRPLTTLIDSKLKFHNEAVRSFFPEENYVELSNGDRIGYEHLVVTPGIRIDYDSIGGLREAITEPGSPVSTIYNYDTCDKTFAMINKMRSGDAIFTQPAGTIKCAGAPQKVMWLALDYWKRAGLYNTKDSSNSAIKITFATGLPVMFGVPKYNSTLEGLRRDRNVEGLFQHNLTAIDGNTAIFTRLDGKDTIKRKFDFLHAVPKMEPHGFIKSSPIANEAGYVDVDQYTTRHKRFSNIWSVGDASSLPTSKTAAAITSQAPVMVQNILRSMENKELTGSYDGYTSCPLLTEYGKVLLAEFAYGGEPKETLGKWLGINQAIPRRAFYHLKKDFFPWIYYSSMVKGTWGGPNGWIR